MRRKVTFLVGGATAAALALGGLIGGVLAESRSAPATTADPVALQDRALTGVAGGVGAPAVASLEKQVRQQPRDARLLTQLGFAYQLRWRETADPSFLPRSESALRRAVRYGVEDAEAILGLGSLALIRHDFATGVRYGRQAQKLLPGSSRPFGVIGDGLLELGRYDAAFAAFERMVTLRPGLASYSRIAYARELLGDREGAAAAMRLAVEAAGGQPEPTAWGLVELSKLQQGPNRVPRAERLLRRALAVVPGYVPARMELARVELAKGKLASALRQASLAVDATPTPHTFDLRAELLDRARRHDAAQRQRDAGAPLDRELVASGVKIELEIAVHQADFAVAPAQTIAAARRARAESSSIHADDAVGWALARAGRCREALPHAKRALRLGTRDPLKLFHRGYAEGCAGDRAKLRALYAQALAIDPEFSIRWAPVARAALRST